MAPTSAWSLPRWLEWLESGARGGITLGLDRLRQVAARLALSPRPTLSIAGTNGKGSTAHFAARLLTACGRRCGLYTSPHLLAFNERIVIDGAPVADADIAAALLRVEQARDGIPLTYFEYTTLAALVLFADADVDAQVLEVGLGGRLDAVNLVDADVAVITSIGIDHIDLLGATRDAIGAEKAGIARRGRPVVVAEPDPPPGLLAALDAAGAEVLALGSGFCVDTAGHEWHYRDAALDLHGLPLPARRSAATLRNLGAAIRAVACMGVSAQALAAAVRDQAPQAGVPGRLDPRGDVVFDVAHNAEAAHELVDYLAATRTGRDRLLIGMLADKPVAAVARVLASACGEAVAVPLPGPRGMSGEALATQLRAAVPGWPVTATTGISEGLARLRALTGPGDRIIVTGSFLTVCAALAAQRADACGRG